MIARVVVGSRVGVTGVDERTFASIRELCEFANPERARLERLGKWTGRTPKKIVTWRETNGWITFPRGALSDVVSVLTSHGYTVDEDDRTVSPKVDVADRVAPAGELYPYQRRALDSLRRHFDGILVAPPGAGKTNVLLTAAAELAVPTLVVVHTRELLRQTAERCRSWLGVEPGVVGGGKWEPRSPVTVATVQTLASRAKELHEVRREFGAVMIDEVHHAPARSWTAVVDRVPALYRYGFTATPYRKDGLDRLIELAVGPVRATIEERDTVDAGKTVKPTVVPLFTGRSYAMNGPDDWGKVLTEIAEDPVRNARIAGEVHLMMERGADRVLVLTDRVIHVRRLAPYLAEMGHPAVELTGELTKVERLERMTAVRAGAPVTVATSQLLGEGVDVPGWDALVLASPMARGPRVIQAVGRVARASSGKTRAVVVDLVDDATPTLMNAWRGRRAMYRRNGWTVTNW